MFKSIRALAIYVTDMEKAKKFYTEVLGFEVSSEMGPALIFLKSRSQNIHIYLEAGNKPTPVDNKTSRLSFFLQAENSASLTYAALKAEGVELLQEAPRFVGNDTYCFQFKDPDGNILEVAAPG